MAAQATSSSQQLLNDFEKWYGKRNGFSNGTSVASTSPATTETTTPSLPPSQQSQPLKKKSYYDILGIARDASQDTVKKVQPSSFPPRVEFFLRSFGW